VRSDSTTRNKRRAAALSATYDSLEERIAELSAAEDLARVRPDLDGNAIMEILGIGPGRRSARRGASSRTCGSSAAR
jgi:poly(A) polymerase